MMATLSKIPRQIGPLLVPSFAVLAAIVSISAGVSTARGDAPAQKPACQGDNGGLALSPGFCATIFADNLGHVRHLVVAPDGTLYANSWSGRYFPVNWRRTLPLDRRPRLTPFWRRVQRAALAPAERVGVAQPGRARLVEELILEDQARFLKRQLSLPVSTMSQW
jgi:hypothetical protein